jgi:hypothetical protein
VLVALGNDLIGKISMSHFSWLWPSAAWMSVIR